MNYKEIKEPTWKASRLNIFDKIQTVFASIYFSLLSGFLYNSGNKSLIYYPIKTFDIGNISIGSKVEIRSYCLLDARSNCNPCIVIGDFCRIKESVTFAAYGGRIIIGKHVLIGSKSSIHGHGDVYFDDYCGVGPGVIVVTSNHIFDDPLTPWQYQGEKVAAVHICKNAWIGAGTIILAGVTIGKGAVIGAGSVVVNDIPERVVAVGNPCIPVKTLRK